MKTRPGEIWLADLGLAAKVRPVLVVSRHDPDAPRALTIYLPLTTQHRGSPYEVPVGSLQFLDQASVVNVQGVGAVIEPRLVRKLGSLPADTFTKVKEALRFICDL
ncbi:MAG: type II toxin-antitoxin system PemK/MazF family toxin [Nitrospira sp.]|nr:type II toxin-antitoxin system PemK/MazF family toxin [Nitrospira sp.]